SASPTPPRPTGSRTPSTTARSASSWRWSHSSATTRRSSGCAPSSPIGSSRTSVPRRSGSRPRSPSRRSRWRSRRSRWRSGGSCRSERGRAMNGPTARPRARSTAQERRVELLAAALSEFAIGGLHGTSTEAIAKRAGISHAYLFRLFGDKKQLFIACAALCFRRVHETFAAAAVGATPQERLDAMGRAYREMLADRELLLAQLQLYAACS